MNSKLLIIASLVCMAVVPAFGTFTIALASGYGLTAAGTTLLASGLLAAKVTGIAIGLGLRRVSWPSLNRNHWFILLVANSIASSIVIATINLLQRSRMKTYRHYRHGRDVSDNEVSNPELLFQSFEESDPAHCFRRYICDLETGELSEKISHKAINNLFLKMDYSKSASFEYDIAAKLGQKLKSVKECEEIYDCPLSGEQLDKLFDWYWFALKFH